MTTFNQTFQKHPTCELEKKLKTSNILTIFHEWVSGSSFDDWNLSLYRFCSKPLAYFNENVVDISLQFFEDNPIFILESLEQFDNKITHAIFSLIRGGSSWDKEEQLSITKPEGIFDFEQTWHPEYQRYCEHIFNHLIQIPLYVLGKINRKDYNSPPLANRIEILKNNNLSLLTNGYNSIVRNAISHGSSLFEHQEIRYVDTHDEELLTAEGFGRLFDQLVDANHSIVIALLLFLSKKKSDVLLRGIKSLPLGIKYLFVDGGFAHTGFEIGPAVESRTIHHEAQLNIYCTIRGTARVLHIFESLHLVWSFLKFGGRKYDRFAVMIDCGKTVSSVAFLNGKKLKEVIDKNLPLNAPQIQEILEKNSLLWFDEKNVVRRLCMLRNLYTVLIKMIKMNIIEEWKKIGLAVIFTRYQIRKTINKSAGGVRRVEAWVVLKDNGIPDLVTLKRIVAHAVNKIRWKLTPNLDIGKTSKIKLPPSYIWIRIYSQDQRIRTLASTGWQGENLLLQAEWISVFHRKKPILIKSADFIYRNIRIKVNPGITF
jgi:hypothetical protein